MKFTDIDKPYTYREYKPGFLIDNEYYEIIYEENPIYIVSSRKMAREIIGMLNGAYSIGYIDCAHLNNIKFEDTKM